jgi:hypothetical protein
VVDRVVAVVADSLALAVAELVDHQEEVVELLLVGIFL